MLPPILSSFLPSCFHSGSNLHYGLMAPLGSSGSLPIFLPGTKKSLHHPMSSPSISDWNPTSSWLRQLLLKLEAGEQRQKGRTWGSCCRWKRLTQQISWDHVLKVYPPDAALTPLIFITEVTGYPGHFLKCTNLCSWLQKDFRMISPIKMDNPSSWKWKIIMLCQSTLIPEKMDQ